MVCALGVAIIIELSQGIDLSLIQFQSVENPRDGGAWWAAVYGVAQSGIGLKRERVARMILKEYH